MRLPLTEVDLSWLDRYGEFNMSHLCDLLNRFTTPYLSNLYLPWGWIRADAEDSCEALAKCLCSIKHLRYLDFGDQAGRFTPNRLFKLAGSMPSLEFVVAQNLT